MIRCTLLLIFGIFTAQSNFLPNVTNQSWDFLIDRASLNAQEDSYESDREVNMQEGTWETDRAEKSSASQERGGARQSALEEATAAKRAAEGRVPPFHAAPVPPTLTHQAPLPPVAEKPPTSQQPFNLISEVRHHEVRVPSLPQSVSL